MSADHHSRIYFLTKRFIPIAGRNEYIESGEAALQINLDSVLIEHMGSANSSNLDFGSNVTLIFILFFQETYNFRRIMI